jgi:acyl-CoA thioesterase FadM
MTTVCVRLETMEKIDVPDAFRERFQQILEPAEAGA